MLVTYAAVRAENPPATTQPAKAHSQSDELRTKIAALKQLRADGAIDDKQYTDAVQKLLASFVEQKSESNADVLGKPVSKPDFACSYYDAKIPEEIRVFVSFSEGARFEGAVREILDIQGIQNFIVQPANVPNAMATANQGNRFILYNPNFVQELKSSTGTNWAVYSVVAHEIGHHLLNHTATPGGSRPDLELQADEYSGFVMYKLHATLEQAQLAMSTISSDQASATHPGKRDRLAAIVKGWNKAKSLSKNDEPQPSQPKPEPKSPPTPAPKPQPAPKSTLVPCIHQIECVHRVACVHPVECTHRINCQHAIPCQHPVMTPYGPQPAHRYDTIHPFDLMHPADAQHPYDTTHPFDLQHPNGDRATE